MKQLNRMGFCPGTEKLIFWLVVAVVAPSRG